MHNFYFMNDTLQGNNIDDDLRTRLGLAPGASRPARPAIRSISPTTRARRSGAPSSATGSGSSALCGAGASTSSRLARSTPTAARRSTTTESTTTWAKRRGKSTSNTRTSFMFNRNLKYRFHRRDAPYPLRRGQGDGAAGSAGPELRRPGQPRRRAIDGARRAIRPDVGHVSDPLSG